MPNLDDIQGAVEQIELAVASLRYVENEGDAMDLVPILDRALDLLVGRHA